MKNTLKALALVILTASTAVAAPAGSVRDRSEEALPTLEWNQLSDADLGENRIVCGPVASAMGPGDHNVPGLPPTLGSLTIGGEPTDDFRRLTEETHRFKIVVPLYDETFPKNPKQYFKGKEACVAAPIALALVGGYEVLPSHGSQIAIRGQGTPVIPRARVKSLPAGAVSYEDAKKYVGETRTVCGVVQSVWENMVPARMFPPGFAVPKFLDDRLPPEFALSTEQRLSHELYLGDRLSVVVTLIDESIKSVTRSPRDYYRAKDVCVTGLLKPSIYEGVTLTVERAENIKIIG